LEKDLEDLDGWRGYIAPLKGRTAATTTATRDGNTNTNNSGGATGRRAEERIIAEHMGSGETALSRPEKKEGIISIATCRASSGHCPIHMACISHSNLVVCVDPHLYLSWYVMLLRLRLMLFEWLYGEEV
jgi:hypothetical protein